jgi:cytochrome P450
VVDPFSPEFLADPYPIFADLRERHPVLYSEPIDHWMLSRYEDVRTALKDVEHYSAANALDPIQPPSARSAEILRDGGFRPIPTLTNTDPPVHTRGRRIANIAFTLGRVASMEGFVRDLVGRFLDERLRDGRADVVQALTWELPALVIFKVLGIPDEDVPRVKEGAGHRLEFMFGRPSEEHQAEIAGGLARFWRYAEELVASRVAHATEDFTTDLVRTPDATGQPLSPGEAATVVFGLLLAGHETTTNLLTNALRRFLERRSIWDELCADPSLIPGAVEEVLRHDSSVIVWRRKTRVPVQIHDVEVPAGARLLLLIGAANHDPDVFPDPDVIDIRRPNAKAHLSFGSGAHLCLGAPLARLEARVVLEELTRRLPSLRIVPGQDYRFHPNISFRGPRSLLVEWGA